ncbi:MAG: hypothetical protein AB8G11_09600 [Saprospiraceae bacterium]
MANNQKNLLDKKVPLNLSVRNFVKIEFEKKCDELGINKSLLADSIIYEYLKTFNDTINNSENNVKKLIPRKNGSKKTKTKNGSKN